MSFLSPRPDDLFRWRYLRTVLILAVIIGLIPGFYAFEAVRGRRAWRAYEQEAMQRGVKLKFAEFIPPAVPDSENFASLPIFDEAFRASGADAGRPSPLSLRIGEAVSAVRPDFADPLNQSNVDLGAWCDYLQKAGLLDVRTDDVAGDVLRAVDKLSAPLDQLREGARRPHCRFPVRWEKNVEVKHRHVPVMQDAIGILTLRIAAQLAQGNSAGATVDLEDGLRLISAIRNEPALISSLVRVWMLGHLLDAIWGGLEVGAWSDADLRRIDAGLAAFDWLQDYVQVMNSERASVNESLDLMAEDSRFRGRVFARSGPGIPIPSVEWKFRFYPGGWIYQSKVRTNRYFDELVTRVDPSQKRFAVTQATPSAPDFKGEFERFRVLYFAKVAPVYRGVHKSYVRIAAMTDLARAACALERHRLQRGNYPAQLADLVPEHITQLPVEAVNGAPYCYRREDDGRFVLYSVGLDLNDDGGEIFSNAPSDRQRDWVWRYPAR